MGLKDLVGMDISFSFYQKRYKGIVVDSYIKIGDTPKGKAHVEMLLILLEDSTLTYRPVSDLVKIKFTNGEQVNALKQKLRTVKEEDPEELSREHLLDLED